MCPLLSVAFEQLVDERQFILLIRRVERREGVALELQDGHLGSVHVLSVGDLRHPHVTVGLSLEPWGQDLEELWDQILLLQKKETHAQNKPLFHIQTDAACKRHRVEKLQTRTVNQKLAIFIALSSVSPFLA